MSELDKYLEAPQAKLSEHVAALRLHLLAQLALKEAIKQSEPDDEILDGSVIGDWS